MSEPEPTTEETEAKKIEPVDGHRCTETLQCILTTEEATEKSQELARQNMKVSELESQKKEVTSEYASKIKSAEARIQELCHTVSTGRESRQVECQWRLFQPDGDHKQLIRLDTGDVVKTERVTDLDRQRYLFDEDEEAAQEAAAEEASEAEAEPEPEAEDAESEPDEELPEDNTFPEPEESE